MEFLLIGLVLGFGGFYLFEIGSTGIGIFLMFFGAIFIFATPARIDEKKQKEQQKEFEAAKCPNCGSTSKAIAGERTDETKEVQDEFDLPDGAIPGFKSYHTEVKKKNYTQCQSCGHKWDFFYTWETVR